MISYVKCLSLDTTKKRIMYSSLISNYVSQNSKSWNQ